MEMTNEIRQQYKMCISFFNIQANTRYFHDKEFNQQAVVSALNAANGNVAEVKEFFKGEIKKGNKSLIKACEAFCKMKKSPVPIVVETPAPTATPASAATGVNPIDFIGQIVAETLAKTSLSAVENAATERLCGYVRKFVADNYGTITRKIEFQLPEKKVELEGVLHSKFDTVLKFVQANEPVFLTGPAGSGKNVICQQVAKALDLPFYFSNAVTQEYKITGFTDAMGVFHESQFYKAFKNGGVFMLDEMDASIPEVLIILNAAIANRYFDFPAPIGYVEAHKDFRVIAAGNTFGYGADYEYVGRSQLDAASLDRFAQVRIDYDSLIEEACANGDKDLLKFCRQFRKAVQKAGIKAIVSYRSISRMAKLSGLIDITELLDTCLLKALDVDDLNTIASDVNGCGKYTEAFTSVLGARRAK